MRGGEGAGHQAGIACSPCFEVDRVGISASPARYPRPARYRLRRSKTGRLRPWLLLARARLSARSPCAEDECCLLVGEDCAKPGAGCGGAGGAGGAWVAEPDCLGMRDTGRRRASGEARLVPRLAPSADSWPSFLPWIGNRELDCGRAPEPSQRARRWWRARRVALRRGVVVAAASCLPVPTCWPPPGELAEPRTPLLPWVPGPAPPPGWPPELCASAAPPIAIVPARTAAKMPLFMCVLPRVELADPRERTVPSRPRSRRRRLRAGPIPSAPPAISGRAAPRPRRPGRPSVGRSPSSSRSCCRANVRRSAPPDTGRCRPAACRPG